MAPTAVDTQKRSDDDILSQAPIKAKFGTAEYDIKVLRINQARKWRETLVAEVNEITKQLRTETGSDETFMSGLGFTLLRFPEKMANLVFSYAPDLPKEKIEEEATEEQMSRVFAQIVQVAFPFQGELRMVMSVLGTAASSRQ